MSGCRTCGGYGNKHDPIAHDAEMEENEALVGKPKKARPRLASEMPGWIGSEPPPDVLTEDDSWDRWPA